jgi:hypothetical protein
MYFHYRTRRYNSPEHLLGLLTTAKNLATSESGNAQQNRRKVLDHLANGSSAYGAFGDTEPAQDHLAVNCAWASLESAIGAAVGPGEAVRQREQILSAMVTKLELESPDWASKLPRGTAG